jgi:hypothetical protein
MHFQGTLQSKGFPVLFVLSQGLVIQGEVEVIPRVDELFGFFKLLVVFTK